MSKSSTATRAVATPKRVTAHPGEVLNQEFLEPLGMSVNALAIALRVPATLIGAIVKGERSVTQLHPHAFWFDNADEYVRLYGSPGEPPAPFAPILRYRRSRQELASHMRSAFAPVYDFRKPIEKVRDRVIDRLARAA